MSTSESSIEIVEVAPRDGFQSISTPLPSEEKIAIILSLFDAGCRRVEIGSFVSPKTVPQMSDMDRIAAAVLERLAEDDTRRASVLVPNRRGAELALRNGLREIVYVFSASEAHNRENVRRTVTESLEELARIVAELEGEAVHLRVALGTSFDCPFEGAVAFDTVRDCVRGIRERAPRAEIALCDTTGRASPFEVGRRFEAMRDEAGEGVRWAFHGHDTFGQGVANALAAWHAGVRMFDASCGGLGGCPFAPGASGNTATEDLVYAFAAGGVRTGINLHALLDVAERIAVLPGGVTGGHLRNVPRERVRSRALPR